MSTSDLAARVRELHAETIAAVQARQLLATNARQAIIEAVNDGLICRAGADDALTGWGLPTLPRAWTVSAPDPAAARLPDSGDDLATATAVRDAAVAELAALRRDLRVTAIAALVDGELSGEHEQAAARVERFLCDLGLAALPQAHHTTVVAEVKLRVRAVARNQARDAVWAGMRTAIDTGPDESRPWIARGWVASTVDELRGGWWRVTWWHAYQVWLRGHTNPAHAAARAEAMARRDLATAPVGFDVESMTLTHTYEGFGIDQLLDPDTD
jgi:hypothetical protein